MGDEVVNTVRITEKAGIAQQFKNLRKEFKEQRLIKRATS